MPRNPPVLIEAIAVKREPLAQTETLRRLRNQQVIPKGDAIGKLIRLQDIMIHNTFRSFIAIFEENVVAQVGQEVVDAFVSGGGGSIQVLTNALISSLIEKKAESDFKENLGWATRTLSKELWEGPLFHLDELRQTRVTRTRKIRG